MQKSKRSVVPGVLAFLAACAKVGDPLPPVTTPAPPVAQFEVIQQARQLIVLSFETPAGAFKEARVFRQCEDFSGPLPSRPLIEVRGRDVSSSRPFVTITDPHPQFHSTCRYFIQYRLDSGGWSPLSGPITTVDLGYPKQPTNLRAEVSEQSITVRWDPPRETIDGRSPPVIAGYLINSRHFVQREEFRDEDFQFGVEQRYSVQAIANQDHPLVTGEPSSTLVLVPQDVFPPVAPAGFNAVYVDGTVQLFWDANSEKDLQGYQMYRGTEANDLKKSSPIIGIARYTDENPPRSTEVFYQVTALDRRGNESPRSELKRVNLIQ